MHDAWMMEGRGHCCLPPTTPLNHYAHTLNPRRHIYPLYKYTLHRHRRTSKTLPLLSPSWTRLLIAATPRVRCLLHFTHSVDAQAPIPHAPHLTPLPTHLPIHPTQALISSPRVLGSASHRCLEERGRLPFAATLLLAVLELPTTEHHQPQ